MKNYISFVSLIPILGIITLSSCRIVKQRSEQVDYSKDQTLSNGRSQHEDTFHYRDSSGFYWLFSTDTTFYYHPDSGLCADRGKLFFWKQQVKSVYRSTVQDSAYSQVLLQEKYSRWSSYYKKAKESMWVLGVCMLLFLGIGWYVYTRVRTFF